MIRSGTISSSARRSNANDPNFSNVSLLLHMDGENEGTVFIDSSLNNFTITNNGGAEMTTISKKFGPTSGGFGNGNQYLSISSNSTFDFGVGDFTIEFWVMRFNDIGNQGLFCLGSYTDGIVIRVGSSPDQLYIVGDYYDWNPTLNVPIDTWKHIALTRQSGLVRIFVDGISILSFTNAVDIPVNDIVIGASSFDVLEGADSFIDELRVTKGVARYTSNFTPQTEAFPNS